ncbi:MAG: hypothetical protein ACI85F_002071, partial [Bacteroidia bacterium]
STFNARVLNVLSLAGLAKQTAGSITTNAVIIDRKDFMCWMGTIKPECGFLALCLKTIPSKF